MYNPTSEYLDQCRDALAAEQAESLAQTSNWAHVDKPKVHGDWDVLYKKLSPMIDSCQPSAEAVQKLVAEHYAIVSRFYKPTKEAYMGMCLFYESNDDMRMFHNTYHPGMAEYMGKAMSVYALTNL